MVLAILLALGVSSASYAQTDDTIVVLHTRQGPLVIEFFADDAPNHVASFVGLVEDGFYDDTIFHRIIPGFMIQGGDPNTRSASGAPPSQWGTGGPDFELAAEFNTIQHDRGIVSMARSSSPDSAGSQFFIVHQNSSFLDSQYTVFGRLATQESYDTLDAIAAMDTIENDRPDDPERVRVMYGETLTYGEALSTDLLLLEQGPPARVQTEEPTIPPNREYISEEMNFSVAFPEGWTLQEPDGDGLPYVVAVAPVMGTIPSSIMVYVQPANGTSLDAAISSKVANLESLQETGELEILHQETIKINEWDMFILDASGIFVTQTDIINIQYREVTTVIDDTIYTLLFSADATRFDTDLPLFEETVSSFNVLVLSQPPLGGSCLIATAAFGSELAPQIQQLRELRDGTIYHTDTGRAFLDWFHTIYYSFSPTVADYERENPAFRDTVRLAITPMLHILSTLEHVDMDTDAGALLYGSAAISLILLVYLGSPAVAAYWLWRVVRLRVAPVSHK